MPSSARSQLAFWFATLLSSLPVAAQSNSALRFFGTGVGPPGQQDRARIPIDDNLPGPAGHTPCDVGAGSFSLDFWLRARLADNPAPTNPGQGDTEHFDFRWIEGNIVVDRDIWGASSRDWGVSLAGGRVLFGTGRADSAALDSEHTLEGSVNILDDAWHHVCLVRDASTGVKRIYIDGLLDIASPPNRSRDNISYPDPGVADKVTPWCPFIVLAAEKHDAGAAYPSFNGFLDEFRIWNIALAPQQVLEYHDRILPASTPGLVGSYRFEEGAGTTLSGLIPGAPIGQLINGTPGNGQWVTRDQSPLNTAPVAACDADFNVSGAVSVQDLFDFLSAYFTADARADINRSGSITVQDLFDFLSAYFTPC